MSSSAAVLSFDDWSVTATALCTTAREDVLLRSASVLGWPTASEIAQWLARPSFLCNLPRGGGHADRIDDSDAPIIETEQSVAHEARQKDCAQWWSALAQRSGLDVMGFKSASPPVFEYLCSKKDLRTALIPLLQCTPKEQLEKWLLSKSAQEVDQSNAYDKCSTLGMLVKAGATDVLSCLSETLPSWPHLLDKKSRTPLFYARSAKMVSFLIDAGVNPHHLNDMGQTAPSFWSEVVQSKRVPLWVGAWGEKSSSDTQDFIKDSMMLKWASLAPADFTDKEKECFLSDMTSPASKQIYTGRLFGVDRSWTLAEAWCMGELQLANAYSSLGGQANRYHATGSPLIGDLTKFMTDISARRTQLTQENIDVLRLNATPDAADLPMGQRVLRWLVQAHHPTVAPVGLWNSSSKFEAWRTENQLKHSAGVAQLSRNFIKNLTAPEKMLWSQEMVPFWGAPWLYSALGRSKLQPVLENSCLPIRLGGLATPELAASWSVMLQEEGVRHHQLSDQWLQSAAASWRKSWLPAEKTTEDWAPVLRIALCLLGSPSSWDSPAASSVEKSVVEMIDAGVPMDKVPWRWAKNYTPELKSRVDKWIIEKTIEKSARHRAAAAIAPAPSKRRM